MAFLNEYLAPGRSGRERAAPAGSQSGLRHRNRLPRSLWLVLGLWLASTALQTGSGASNPSHSLEYKIKAAYLFNFAKYIEWPSRAFPGPASPIVVGVLGQDPFGGILEDTIGERRVGKRSVLIERSRRVEDLKNCHLIFISLSERDRLPRMFTALKGSCALTVSEIPRFCFNGGMVTFILENDVVRFDIDLDNAEEAGLSISARLLATARNVFARKRNPPK